MPAHGIVRAAIKYPNDVLRPLGNCTFQCSPSDATLGGVGGWSQMIKFEEVSNNHHQMSLAGNGDTPPGFSWGWEGWGPITTSKRTVIATEPFHITMDARVLTR